MYLNLLFNVIMLRQYNKIINRLNTGATIGGIIIITLIIAYNLFVNLSLPSQNTLTDNKIVLQKSIELISTTLLDKKHLSGKTG
jgi:hypothetical protein